MSSMIEQIKEIEEKASAIRLEAIQNGRERLAQAQEQVRQQKLSNAEAEREMTRTAMQKAETEGEALSKDIIAKREQEAEQACKAAEEKLREAVQYLIRRVVNNA